MKVGDKVIISDTLYYGHVADMLPTRGEVGTIREIDDGIYITPLYLVEVLDNEWWYDSRELKKLHTDIWEAEYG